MCPACITTVALIVAGAAFDGRVDSARRDEATSEVRRGAYRRDDPDHLSGQEN
jgi:hypothetical protein